MVLSIALVGTRVADVVHTFFTILCLCGVLRYHVEKKIIFTNIFIWKNSKNIGITSMMDNQLYCLVGNVVWPAGLLSLRYVI